MITTNIVKYLNGSWKNVSQNRLLDNVIYMIARPISIDHKKIEHFSAMKNFWWDENGPVKGLHQYVPMKTQLVKDGLVNVGVKLENSNLPLNGIKIVDVGCGGGIMTEALARIGAQVTGIDVSAELINLAEEHLKLNPDISGRVNYIYTSLEDFAEKERENNTYDAILISEVLQYVTNPQLFLKECAKIVKPGKSIFITTPNRTLISWLFIIVAAQCIVGSVPRGIMKWNKFVTPDEIQRILKNYDCKTISVCGMIFNPVTRKWSWSSNVSHFYGLHAIK